MSFKKIGENHYILTGNDASENNYITHFLDEISIAHYRTLAGGGDYDNGFVAKIRVGRYGSSIDIQIEHDN